MALKWNVALFCSSGCKPAVQNHSALPPQATPVQQTHFHQYLLAKVKILDCPTPNSPETNSANRH
jgi:hypothetical protein